MSVALPAIELREVVDLDTAASVIGPLQDEIADLEAELARLDEQCARVDAEISEGVEPGSSTAGRAAAAAERLVHGWLTAEREAMWRQVEEAERVATEGVRRAEDEATELVRAARVEVATKLLQWLGGAVVTASVPVDGAPAHLGSFAGEEGAPAGVIVSGTAGRRLAGEDPEAARGQADWTEAASPAAVAEHAPPEVTLGDEDDTSFGAFWHESDKAAVARSLVLAPLGALLPMFAALWVIVALFLFVI